MGLTPIHFRLELSNGKSEEYRIRDGKIETRCRQNESSEEDHDWRELTPEQVTDLVDRNSPVAQWLNRRMGWKKLLRACLPEQTLQCFDALDNSEDRRAA